MAILKKSKVFFLIAAYSGLTFFVLLTYFTSGCYHSNEKVRTILLCTFLIGILIYLLGDPVQFTLMAIDRATWPPKNSPIGIPMKVKEYDHLDYLKLRVDTLKSELTATKAHCDEYLNVNYRLIALDLYNCGKYFLLLFVMVLMSHSELLYSNTFFKQSIFMKNHTSSMGLMEIKNIPHVYYYIETQLIDAFGINDPRESDWQHGAQNKRIGVVALRQLRRMKNTHIGWDQADFTRLDYSTSWKLPFKKAPYTNKYWNIYTPWLYRIMHTPYMLKSFYSKRYGYFQKYHDLEGYVVMLARSRNNSKQILRYLEQNHWLDHNTAMLSMEFVMFNVDSNILSACTLMIEQTPQGLFVANAYISSIIIRLTDLLGTWGLCFWCVYIVMFIEFMTPLVMMLWYEHGRLWNIWNMVDLVIIILNILIIILLLWSEAIVNDLSFRLETAYKTEFIHFDGLENLRKWVRVLLGLLVGLTTLRLWKILQFGRVFQILSTALYTALPTIISTSLMCLIFILGFSIAMAIINGNNSLNMVGFIPSLITALCNCFGFHEHIKPIDFSYGGTILSLICYVIMAVIMAQMLINVLKSMINSNFMETRREFDAKHYEKITFLEFLRVEYAKWFQFHQKFPCFAKKPYKRKNRTVGQNIRIKMKKLDKGLYKGRLPYDFINASDSIKHSQYKKRIERIFTLSKLLQAQMELLEFLFVLDKDNDTDVQADSEYKL